MIFRINYDAENLVYLNNINEVHVHASLIIDHDDIFQLVA